MQDNSQEYWHAGLSSCQLCGATIDHVHPDVSSTRYIAPQSAYKAVKTGLLPTKEEQEW